MAYQKKSAEKSSSNGNQSVGENAASRKGVSFPAVPALQGKFGTAQRAGAEEEEPLQGKFEPVQKAGMDEEEPVQGKFETVQKAEEEEEPLQGKFEPVQKAGMDEEEPMQAKFEPVQRAGAEEEEPVQGKFEPVQKAGPEEELPAQGKFNPIGRKEGEGGLPTQLKAGIESMSGMDLSDVKVHYNSSKPAQLQAYAYAQGNDIHIGAGQEKHLAHEAWHVVQQRQGRVKPTIQMKSGIPVNDDVALETEADVMGAQAAEIGRSMDKSQLMAFQSTSSLPPAAVQRVAQLEDKGLEKLRTGVSGVTDAQVAEKPGTKGEGEEFADSFVDTYGGALSSTADFMTASPLTYTNSSNTKVEDGQTVVDSDKVVTSGHKADPLGKGASAAGVGFGVYTGIFGMYQAIQKFREGEINSKIEGVFSALGSTSTMVKSGADVAKTVSKEKSNTAETAGTTSSIAGTVTDGLDAVKSLVLTIKGIYDAYKDATSSEGSSSREKFETGMATVRGLVESAGKAVSMGKSIADMLQTGSAGLAQAVPGLGIALSSIDLAISIYNLIKSKTSESFIKEQLKKNMWEAGNSVFDKGKSGRKQRQQYVETFAAELTRMRDDLKTLKDKQAAGTITPEEAKRLPQLENAIAVAEVQQAALLENNALTNLKNVNQDRKYNAGFDIAVNITKIVGDVLALVPEPGSQVAGMSLKLIASGSKVAKGLGSKILQWGRDKAAGAPDSKLAKLFDATKSGDAVKERHKGTIMYIFSSIKSLPDNPQHPTFKSKYDTIEQIISSAGCEPQALYRAVSGGTIDDGVQLLFKSLSK